MAAGNIVPLWICYILLPFLQAFCVVSFAACANKQFVNYKIFIDGNSAFGSKKLQSFVLELLRAVGSVFWDGIIPIGNVEIKCLVSEKVSPSVLVAAKITCQI